MLGHPSYGRYANGSEARITAPLRRDAWANVFQGEPYYPFVMRDRQLSGDLPHDRGTIATQLHRSAAAGTYAMDGFAKSYFTASPNNRTTKPDPLGFLLLIRRADDAIR